MPRAKLRWRQKGASMAGSGRADSRSRRYVKAVLDAFADMPHRGSGTHYEARAARLLTRIAEASLKGKVESQPFAVDLSSGAWNVALHGSILCSILGLGWLAGLGISSAYGSGRGPVPMGFLGTVPWPVAVLCTVTVAVLIVSRWMAGRCGWAIFSFLLPNADSSNVIISTFAPPDKELLRAPLEKQWADRFEKAGKRRLFIISAHYDSARCLPPTNNPTSKWKSLLAALKNGIGIIPTIAYFLLLACFAASTVIAFLGGLPGPVGGILGHVLAALAVLGFIVACAEAVIAGLSVNKPFEQGYNDDLSGVAAALGAYFRLCPKSVPAAAKAREEDGGSATKIMSAIGSAIGTALGGLIGSAEGQAPQAAIAGGLLPGDILPEAEEPPLEKTGLIVLLTGSEENGLRGATEFRKVVLKAAKDHFDLADIHLVNVDSVSGGSIYAAATERNFMGARRGGDPGFAGRATGLWATPLLTKAEADSHFTEDEEKAILLPVQGGDGIVSGYGYAIQPQPDPVAACTDMTAFCSKWAWNHHLPAFTLVSVGKDSGPIPQPRDYHQPSDTYETMFRPDEPGNFGTVLGLSLALADLVREIDK